jgi:hypothetical protein
MPDNVYGDQYKQTGANGVFTVNNNSGGVPRAEVDAAVAELRAFVAQLARQGVVGPDGSVRDPGAVVAAVEAQSGKLRTLGKAIAGGAKDAILSVARDGVAALIVALLGRP